MSSSALTKFLAYFCKRSFLAHHVRQASLQLAANLMARASRYQNSTSLRPESLSLLFNYIVICQLLTLLIDRLSLPSHEESVFALRID
jgi:hypothetical protein